MATISAAPPRTIVQRMEALQLANDIRSRRAVLKRDLKAGRKHAVDVLLDPPAWVETMKVADLLVAVPKWGRGKANKALYRAQISPSKSIGGLSPRQRAELAGAIR